MSTFGRNEKNRKKDKEWGIDERQAKPGKVFGIEHDFLRKSSFSAPL